MLEIAMFSCLKKQEEKLSLLVQLTFSFTNQQNTLVGNIHTLDNVIIFWCLEFELGKIWNKLIWCDKILINQPNVPISSGCKSDNQFFVA